MKSYIPKDYKTVIGVYDTQRAIGTLHNIFEENLSKNLHLRRVSAPLFVEASSGLNDDLNGVERPVSFDITATGTSAQVVHSLAKWKRLALHNYTFYPGNGLYTDMNAIRRDEDLDNIHSIYVDQWDWEKVITREQRTIEYLKETVNNIVRAICDAHDTLKEMFPTLTRELDRNVSFVTSQELEDMYPDKTAKEREDLYVREHHTTFIMQIGGILRSGKKHDGRAPDYDDWELNGDILLWDEVLNRSVELSSMGIRVDEEAMDRQLKAAGADDRRELEFHKAILNKELPYSIGGGIGQSRLCMYFLRKAHIGEVQVSVWPQDMIDVCKENNIFLL